MVMLLDLNQQVSKLRMIDALRSVLPYSTTLAQNDAYLAYSDGRKAGSRHTWKKAGMKGEPPGWEEVEEEAGENGELTMEEDLQAIEARVEKSANFLPELLGRLERKVVGEALAAHPDIRVVTSAFTARRSCSSERPCRPAASSAA